jgi:hypothetical protein
VAGKAWRQQQGWSECHVLLMHARLGAKLWRGRFGTRFFVQAAQQNPALRLIHAQ